VNEVINTGVSGTDPSQRQLNGPQTSGRAYRNLSAPSTRQLELPAPAYPSCLRTPRPRNPTDQRLLVVRTLQIHRPVGSRKLVRVTGRSCSRRADQLAHFARG